MLHLLRVNDARMSPGKVVFIVCFIVGSVAINETAGEKSVQVCILSCIDSFICLLGWPCMLLLHTSVKLHLPSN